MIKNGLSFLLVTIMVLGTVVCPCDAQADVTDAGSARSEIARVALNEHAHHSENASSANDSDCAHGDCETPCIMLSASPRTDQAVIATALQLPELDGLALLVIAELAPPVWPAVADSTLPSWHKVLLLADTPVRRFDRLLD